MLEIAGLACWIVAAGLPWGGFGVALWRESRGDEFYGPSPWLVLTSGALFVVGAALIFFEIFARRP